MKRASIQLMIYMKRVAICQEWPHTLMERKAHDVGFFVPCLKLQKTLRLEQDKKLSTKMGVPSYSDLGKAAKDLLGKDYPTGSTKLELNTTTASGIVRHLLL